MNDFAFKAIEFGGFGVPTDFIDTRRMGILIDRIHRELSEKEIAAIADTYQRWREDILGFCKSATLADIRAHHHVLTPGRYVGSEAIEDEGVLFEEKMAELAGRLYDKMRESVELDAVIRKNLEVLGYGE
jgi:type I restriction enzyme M protein